MNDYTLDDQGHFIIHNYAAKRPFSSFLPGIAGPLGIPLWVFYVNRGQAIASFGIETKDNPIVEFEPANKAYYTTSYTGFRTFLKLRRGPDTAFYEPFAPWSAADDTRMRIGMNELQLDSTSAAHAVHTSVLYFVLPGEPFAALVRHVAVTNLAEQLLTLELLDGLPRVIPYGADNRGLKEIGRTLEAWMAVFNLDHGLPFYRFQASPGDTAQVSEIHAGHFYLAFDGSGRRLAPFVDPVVLFGHNTALNTPDRFLAEPLADLRRTPQITTGRTPCGFFGATTLLQPGEAAHVYAIVGHAAGVDHILRDEPRLAQPAYVQEKRREANDLIDQLTAVVAAHTSSPLFDAYTRHTLLDNVLRGGWPLLLGDQSAPAVYHIYSRKHGDLERDYNYFALAAEPYSQGNAAYRDVNQNRRCDVLLQPAVGAFNVLSFLALLQADGYNPLVVEGSRFTLPPDRRPAILALVDRPQALEPLLARPFTPGRLLRAIADHQLGLKVTPETLLAQALTHTEQHLHAAFGEGYWIDHWTYNLDLIDTYLAVYPDRRDDLLFTPHAVPYFDSAAVVQPRALKYVLVAGGRVRQLGAVIEDKEKAALIAARAESPNLFRAAHGRGEIYRTTVLAKLLGLALIKFATLDPLGIGVEMEAGRPGWYDALNGLPALFGSSLCETYELDRLFTLLLEAMTANQAATVELPVEQHGLLLDVSRALDAWQASAGSDQADRDFRYWDAVATAREDYRLQIRLGLEGTTGELPCSDLIPLLAAFQAKVRVGTSRAVDMNGGVPPTYLAYTVADYDLLPGADPQGRPYVRAKRFEPSLLPLFLEGPVHALKVQPTLAQARRLYAAIRAGDLYDGKLGMYKVNASLQDQPHDIGRARAFTPGWLENESIWLHMEYKYLLELLRAGLYEEFYEDSKRALICFQDPAVYGRSPLENSSFLVSSAHPDPSLHGAGFVARLSGATAEFLSIWTTVMAGPRPFFLHHGALCLDLRPALPGWLFDAEDKLTFTFLGHTPVTVHNPHRVDTWRGQASASSTNRLAVLHLPGQEPVTCPGGIIPAPYAAMVRAGQAAAIDLFLT